MLAPKGSPRIVTETMVAGRYFRAQFKLLCPRTVGTRAKLRNMSQVKEEKSVRGRPRTRIKSSRLPAALP